MRIRWGVVLGSVLAVMGLVGAGVLGAAPAGATAVARGAGSGGGWGSAEAIATAGKPGNIESMACASAGYCVAVGTYTQPFAVSYDHGTWGKITAISTTALLRGSLGTRGNQPDATLNLVACPAAGDCTAFGTYESYDYGSYPFVVNQRNGKWGKANPVGGLPGLGDTLEAAPTSVACVSAGNCVAGGQFDNAEQSENTVPFLVREKNGAWGQAEAVPGSAPVASVDQGNINSMSCAATGACVAVGFYATSTTTTQFVVTGKNGVWGSAQAVPGVPAKDIVITLASCAPAGTCTIGGAGFSGAEHNNVFTVTERNGRWGKVTPVPGTSLTGFQAVGLSCRAGGDCSLVGTDTTAKLRTVSYAAVEHNGAWAKAAVIPGLAALDHGYSADVLGLACGVAGNCAAGGWANVDVSAHLVRSEAYVVSESGGVWRKAQVVKGIDKLDGDGDSFIFALACASANHCLAGGTYEHNNKFNNYSFAVAER
jgi:hypothetical protein